MSWWKFEKSSAGNSSTITTSERRQEPRIGGQFKVRYSGTHENELIMGHATIVDVSRYGFGLTGGRGLKQGMELALFLEMSDMDENLCIPQAFVSWISGSRFGVDLRAAREKEPVWLEFLAG